MRRSSSLLAGEARVGTARRRRDSGHLGALRRHGRHLEVGQGGHAALPAVGKHHGVSVLDEAQLLGEGEAESKTLLDVGALLGLRVLRRDARKLAAEPEFSPT